MNFLRRCDIARSTLIDAIVNKYKGTIEEYRATVDGNEEPDEDDLFNVTQSLKKVATFYSSHNMNPWEIWDSLFKDIIDAFPKLVLFTTFIIFHHYFCSLFLSLFT